MTPDEVLDRAADEITIRGWTQGLFEDPEGRVCAVGAINRTTAQATERIRAGWVLTFFIQGQVPIWNDAPGRTQDEVVDTFRLAAKHYREVHQS